MVSRYHEVVARDAEIRWAVEEAYDRAFFWARERPYFRPLSGQPGAALAAEPSPWALDARVPLAHADLLRPIASRMSGILQERGIRQIAGYGYGSFLLLGAVLQATPGMSAGLIRDSRKRYGFRRLLEGDLKPGTPIVIIDDVVSSGQHAMRAAAELHAEGLRPAGVLAMFVYSWKGAEGRLSKNGLWLESLATIRHRPAPSGTADA